MWEAREVTTLASYICKGLFLYPCIWDLCVPSASAGGLVSWFYTWGRRHQRWSKLVICSWEMPSIVSSLGESQSTWADSSLSKTIVQCFSKPCISQFVELIDLLKNLCLFNYISTIDHIFCFHCTYFFPGPTCRSVLVFNRIIFLYYIPPQNILDVIIVCFEWDALWLCTFAPLETTEWLRVKIIFSFVYVYPPIHFWWRKTS